MDILHLVAAPGADLNTDGALAWLAGNVVPILLALIGVVFIGRAKRGDIGSVLTGSVIVTIGLVFFGGATVFLAFGKTLATMIVHGGAP